MVSEELESKASIEASDTILTFEVDAGASKTDD